MADHDLAQGAAIFSTYYSTVKEELSYYLARPALTVVHYYNIAIMLLSIPIKIENTASNSQYRDNLTDCDPTPRNHMTSLRLIRESGKAGTVISGVLHI